MTAKLLVFLALASYVPTIDIDRSCRGAESAALLEDRARAYQRCVRDEQTAREELSKTWSRIPIDSRQQCTDVSTESSPSYVELLTCLEMQAVSDAHFRHADAGHRSFSPSGATRSDQQSAVAKQ
jgi:hypothetical protein